ncbi:MAG: hypothetical protein KDA98_01105 [Acidimicrobiales bacterium]|nr:hypothetical protein [Acidimicrobiales bacterium]
MRARLSIVAALAVLVAAGGLTGCKPTSDGLWNYHPISIQGSYQPLVGDFVGDEATDIVWYAPGPGADSLWVGQVGKRGVDAFERLPLRVGGDYEPVVGDFAGDEHDDILWYHPDRPGHTLWVAEGSSRSFSSQWIRLPDGEARVLADHRGPGHKDDLFVQAARRFVLFDDAGTAATTLVEVAVSRIFPLVIGDFDGDDLDDIYFWGGHQPSYLWTVDEDGSYYSRYSVGPEGPFTPVVIRRETTDAILWWASTEADRYSLFEGARLDYVQLPQLRVRGRATATGTDGAVITIDDDREALFVDAVDRGEFYELSPSNHDKSTDQDPLPGDFDGDGLLDLFWYGSGGIPDELWYLEPEPAGSAPSANRLPVG